MEGSVRRSLPAVGGGRVDAMKVLVTGCAGLIGSHLCEALLARGDSVVGVDNFLTGRRDNVVDLLSNGAFAFVEADVCDLAAFVAIDGVDALVHLASPASPTDFTAIPDQILLSGSVGTLNMIQVARDRGARLVFASTSEVYGEPEVHPQPETYLGNVSPTGPRACYDESKRFGEAAVSTYARSYGLDAGIVRIFNTYGPRMRVDDGRVVSNFVVQALAGQPLTVQGDGVQTRCFCFVDDLVRGLVAMVDADDLGPLNLGNPTEYTVLELAKRVIALTGSTSAIEYHPLPQDDPTQRRPDITEARARLGFEPSVDLDDGLEQVIEYFRTLS